MSVHISRKALGLYCMTLWYVKLVLHLPTKSLATNKKEMFISIYKSELTPRLEACLCGNSLMMKWKYLMVIVRLNIMEMFGIWMIMMMSL